MPWPTTEVQWTQLYTPAGSQGPPYHSTDEAPPLDCEVER